MPAAQSSACLRLNPIWRMGTETLLADYVELGFRLLYSYSGRLLSRSI